MEPPPRDSHVSMAKWRTAGIGRDGSIREEFWLAYGFNTASLTSEMRRRLRWMGKQLNTDRVPHYSLFGQETNSRNISPNIHPYTFFSWLTLDLRSGGSNVFVFSCLCSHSIHSDALENFSMSGFMLFSKNNILFYTNSRLFSFIHSAKMQWPFILMLLIMKWNPSKVCWRTLNNQYQEDQCADQTGQG